MTKSILKNNHWSDRNYLPVSTEEAYNKFWLPLATSLSLQLIIDIQYCYTVHSGNLEQLIAEFKVLRQHLIDVNADEWYNGRLSFLISDLEKEIGNPDFEGDIG